MSDKIINNSDNFIIECLSCSKKCNFYVFTYLIESWKTCQLMLANFVFLDIFDTCDVMHDLFISLLPPIVLDNLFGTELITKQTEYYID